MSSLNLHNIVDYNSTRGERRNQQVMRVSKLLHEVVADLPVTTTVSSVTGDNPRIAVL